MTDEPLPKHPLRLRAENAVRGYRETGGAEHLALLRQDGETAVARDLEMERVLPLDGRGLYTERVDAWLAEQ